MTCKKREANASLFLHFFVHAGGIVLADVVGNFQDFHRDGAGAHGNFDLVAYLHIIAGFHYAAVDADAAVIACFIGNSAALDQAGHF